MKYGESGSSDEDGSGSGSDNETEDEEEEEDCQVLLNRVPKRPRQEKRRRRREVPRLLRRWKEYRLPRARTSLKPSVRHWERCRQSIG
jgi:hypothetical protein